MLKLGHNVDAGNIIALLCICLDALSKHCPSRSLSANPAHPILCVPVYLCICFVALHPIVCVLLYLGICVLVYLPGLSLYILPLSANPAHSIIGLLRKHSAH